jgi:hypothetical protein
MSRSRWRMPPRVAAGGGLGGQPAARLVSSNPAEAVSVGAQESGAQTNRERWRESAEISHNARERELTKVIVVVSHSHGPRYLVMLGSSATGLPHVAPPPRRVSSHGRHEIWACNPPDRGRRRRRHSDVAVVQLPGHEDVPADARLERG